MSNKIIRVSKFHDDDIKLSLEYPTELNKYTDLTEAQIQDNFHAIAQVLFDNVLTKDKRDFLIEFNDETQSYEIFTPVE